MKPPPHLARIVHRFRSRTAGEPDLRELEVTSENLKEVLDALVAGVDDLDAVEAKLGLDLHNMTKLMQEAPHNDDLHHNGEDVLVHVGNVMDDVNRLSDNMDEEAKTLLKLTALCHDLGKPYVYRYQEDTKRHTFYDHAATSVKIAEALLAKHKDQLGELYQHVLDFVRLHDVFYALVNDRGQSTTTKYVRGLMRENIYRKGLLKYLLTFAKADSARARSYGDKLKDFERVLTDCERAEQELVEEEAAKARRQAVTLERMPRIKAYLEAEGVPEAADALPDLKAAHRILGTMGRYDLIKGIKAIIDA